MVDSTGTTSYSYDSLYRLTGVTFPGSRTVSYGYDDASRRTSITYPGGSNQVTYAYDSANRLSSVTDWNSNQTTYAYDDANRMTTVTMPNGVVGTSSYDNANRLTDISYVKSSVTLASVSYTLDAVGNRTDRTDLAGTQTYSYDDDYRLTSVTHPGPTTTDYTYDDFGNRASMTDDLGTTNYSYDDAGRLTTVTPPSPASAVSYTSDDNGNVTARGSDSFTWDFENRLTAATVNSTSYAYTYRGDGLRNSATTAGNTTTYTWDVNAGLPVVLDDGSQYVYGNGLVSQVAGANTYYYLADGLGSVMATTDASGAVVNSYTYDVYGKTTASSGSQANDRQFAGQQTDPTGLQYLRARYYDPSTGSFLSRDPLGVGPGWAGNGTSYSDNPALMFDPMGWMFTSDDGANRCTMVVCGEVEGGPVPDGLLDVLDAPALTANVLNVVKELTESGAVSKAYVLATIVSAVVAAHNGDWLSAVEALATIGFGPEAIVPMILLNIELDDFIHPSPAGDPCDYDAVAGRCRESRQTNGEYARAAGS